MSRLTVNPKTCPKTEWDYYRKSVGKPAAYLIQWIIQWIDIHSPWINIEFTIKMAQKAIKIFIFRVIVERPMIPEESITLAN